jgi:hypothetical protein
VSDELAHPADDVAAIKAVASALWGTDPYLGWANIARITIEALRDAGFEVRRIDGSDAISREERADDA